MTTYNMYHVGTMNSQYFAGNSNPVIQILVDGTTTYGELKDRLLSIYDATDHIQDLDVPAYVKQVEMLFSNIEEDKMDTLFNPSLDIPYDEEWDDYDCYAFFALETVEEEEDELS